MLESDEDLEEKSTHHEYLIKSPLLLSSTVKNEQSIAGLSLDSVPRENSNELEPQHTGSLAASSNYYKKWLSVSHQ
jgi:hypothetical protein